VTVARLFRVTSLVINIDARRQISPLCLQNLSMPAQDSVNTSVLREHLTKSVKCTHRKW
jgi:hypothetical protein